VLNEQAVLASAAEAVIEWYDAAPEYSLNLPRELVEDLRKALPKEE
jgi:hypothetical protein